MMIFTLVFLWIVFCYFRALLISDTTGFNLSRANADLDLQHRQWRNFGYYSFKNLVWYRQVIKKNWPDSTTRPPYYNIYF